MKPKVKFNGIESTITDRDTINVIMMSLNKPHLFEDDGSHILYSYDEEKGEMRIGFGTLRELSKKGIIDFEEELNEPTDEVVNQITSIFQYFKDQDPTFTIRPYQVSSVLKAYVNKKGLSEISTGGGKSEIFIALTMLLKVKTLVVNNLGNITRQIRRRYIKRGLTEADVGFSGEDANWMDKWVSVVTVTALNNGIKKLDRDILKLLAETDLIIFDEAHHSPSATWSNIAKVANPTYCLHYSATAFRDADNPLESKVDAQIQSITGGAIVKVGSVYLRSNGWQPNPIVHYLNFPRTTGLQYNSNWIRIRNHLISKNKGRNDKALELLVKLNEIGVKVLVNVDLLTHGDFLLEELDKRGVPSVFSMGGENLHRMINGRIHEFKGGSEEVENLLINGDINIAIGSSVYDEGVDISCLDAIVLMAGGKGGNNSRRFYQRIGRIRNKPNPPNIALVFDFNDVYNIVVQKHLRERRDAVDRESIYVEENFETMLELAKQLAEAKKS